MCEYTNLGFVHLFLDSIKVFIYYTIQVTNIDITAIIIWQHLEISQTKLDKVTSHHYKDTSHKQMLSDQPKVSDSLLTRGGGVHLW